MIKDIEIKNYRGINQLKVGNFEKYNLFVGNNGGCKTTLLEALIIGKSAFPTELIKLAIIRGVLNPESILNSSLKKNKETIINLNNNELKTKLVLKKLENSLLTLLEEQENFTNDNQINREEETIKEYTFEKEYFNEVLSGEIKLETKHEINTKINQKELGNVWVKYLNKSIYITAFYRNEMNLAEKLAIFFKEKKEYKIIEILKKFDKNIEGIKLIGSVIYIDLIGAETLVPLYLLGTGLSSILIIITLILSNQNADLICIDEIEAGIHYLNYKKLAEIILELTKKEEKQVFIATHSNEFLNAFYKVLYKNEQKMKVYQFKRTNENKISYSEYYNQEIEDSVLNGWDLR